MAKIKTFAAACKALGITYTPVEGQPKQVEAFHKLTIIAEALNDGWKPNWDDYDEDKWYPWFVMSKKKFSLGGVGYRFRYSGVSSRLCFKSSDLARYAATTFLKLYKDLYTF